MAKVAGLWCQSVSQIMQKLQQSGYGAGDCQRLRQGPCREHVPEAPVPGHVRARSFAALRMKFGLMMTRSDRLRMPDQRLELGVIPQRSERAVDREPAA